MFRYTDGVIGAGQKTCGEPAPPESRHHAENAAADLERRWCEYQGRFERVEAERRSRALDATRASRFAFGVAMLLGALMLTVRVADAWTDTSGSGLFGRLENAPRVHELLTATWLAAFAAGILVHMLVRFVPALRVGVSGVRSYVMFWVGTALWLPITVHWFWYLAQGNSVKQFDDWATFALAVTAITHVGFAIMVGRRAAQLARGEPPTSVKNIFAWSVVLGALPVGIMLLMIPSIIVALTGIPIVPLLLMMEPLAKAHRDHLDADLPVARVIA